MSKLLTLRWLRRIIAAIFGLLFLFAFIDFSGTFSPKFLNGLLYLQFTPSVLKFLTVGGLIATGFIVVLLLTVLFGRVYCSTFCPLGIFQDFISRLRLKNPRYKFIKPWNIIRYSTLALVVILALAGSLFLLYLLDPYSFAGRIFSDLARPLYFGVNNLLVKFLGLFNSYALHNVPFKGMPWQTIAVTGGLTLALVVMAWQWGRLFCNSFCPVGSLLSILSRYSIFKIKIDEQACTACNRCVRVCKATCIDVKSKDIDFSRCVGCFNCIDSCTENGIGYKFDFLTKKNDNDSDGNTGRRNFFVTLGGIAIGSTLLGKSIRALGQGTQNQQRQRVVNSEGRGQGRGGNLVAGSRPNSRSHPITPPGSLSIDEYRNACTACHLCVSVCPTNVLQPSVREFGLFGMLQPHMDFHSGFCNFECTLCGEVCPTGAIRPLQLETKKRAQIGIARFHLANCIVRTDRTECGACSEHCPTKAVNMIPWQGLHIPQVFEDICIGCGACEYACPTEPFKAIYINGNPGHLVADLPEIFDDKPQESDMDDFPF